MKGFQLFSFVLQLQFIFASTASAYWIRGAAERALYYAVYVLEDLHFNEGAYDGWKVAPGCRGTRSGMWGQKGRCNLAEFLDHIWAPTKTGSEPDAPVDSRPDKAKIKWGSTMVGLSSPQTIVSSIMALQYEDGSEVIQHDRVPKQYGYTGNTDVQGRLLPNEGANNYWDALEKFGPRARQMKRDFDVALANGEIVTDDKDPKSIRGKQVVKKFNAFYGHAQAAAEVVIDFRVQDKWRHLESMVDWKKGLGVDPTWDSKRSTNHNWIGAWKEINVPRTIDKMANDLGISHDDATAKWTTLWDGVTGTDVAKDHQAAITKMQFTLQAMRAPECP